MLHPGFRHIPFLTGELAHLPRSLILLYGNKNPVYNISTSQMQKLRKSGAASKIFD